jgi:hypothetical protein
MTHASDLPEAPQSGSAVDAASMRPTCTGQWLAGWCMVTPIISHFHAPLPWSHWHAGRQVPLLRRLRSRGAQRQVMQCKAVPHWICEASCAHFSTQEKKNKEEADHASSIGCSVSIQLEPAPACSCCWRVLCQALASSAVPCRLRHHDTNSRGWTAAEAVCILQSL